MSYMSIDLDSLKDIEKRVGSLSKSLEQIKNSLSTVRRNIDSTVRNRSGIDSSMSSLIREVGERERIMNNVKQFLKETIKQYEDMEKELRRESDRIIENSTPKTGIIKSILNGLKSIGKKLGNLLKTIAKNSILLSPIIIGTAVRSIGKMLIERGFIITNKPIEIVKRDDIGLPILNGILSYNPDEYSPYVALLQKRLIELGYGDGLEVTGKFDSKTLDAVNRYKEDYGLWNFGEYEGKVGETTWNHLFKNQKVPYLTIDNVEKDGMGIPVLSGILSYNPWEYSIYVVFLQKRLIELGYGDGLEVNGIFDSKTLEAVNRYKEDYGLWNHDEYEGKVGETTWNHLFKNQKVPYIKGTNEFYPAENSTQNNSVSNSFKYNWTGKCVTEEFKEKVLEISKKLKINPDDLMAVIAFESNFDPSARNPASDATGLIQFIPSTAESLGTTVEELKNMSAIQQLDYVYEYLKTYSGRMNDIYDVYMAVFLPIAVGKDNNYVLGVKGSEECFPGTDLTKGKVYKNNSGLDINKDGIITKEEAVQRVIAKRNQYEIINSVNEPTGNDSRTGDTKIKENSNYNVTNTVAYQAVVPKYVYESGERTPEAYNLLIDQFMVETNPRYKPRNGATFCNIYAWDVSVAMGVELPRFVEINEIGNLEDATGKAIGRNLGSGYILYQDVANANATELDANRLATWLDAQGANYGWREISAEEAQRRANQGYMTISVVKEPGGIGHVQVVRPTPDGSDYDPSKGVYISQAGGSSAIKNGVYFLEHYKSESYYNRYKFYTHD